MNPAAKEGARDPYIPEQQKRSPKSDREFKQFPPKQAPPDPATARTADLEDQTNPGVELKLREFRRRDKGSPSEIAIRQLPIEQLLCRKSRIHWVSHRNRSQFEIYRLTFIPWRPSQHCVGTQERSRAEAATNPN